MVAAAQTGSPVLLVGDVSSRLELELASFGLVCAVAQTANDAVARMKTTRFPYVVVPPVLSDMGGVDFIHGVLRHFDASVVLYGNGVESSEINALLRTGRVAHFPAHAEGHVVADFLARRANASSPPSTPTPTARAAPPLQGPVGGGSLPNFNLTPQASALSSALFGTASTNLGATAASSFPPMATSFPPSSSPVPQPNPGFVPTPSGGFSSPVFTPTASPRPPTLGPSPGLSSAGTPLSALSTSLPPGMATSFAPQQAQGQRFEAIVDELARTNSELVMLRGKLGAAEQEKAALVMEVEAARRSAIADVAQVMALSDEGDPISEEMDQLRQKLAAAENDRKLAKSEVDALRAERDGLVADAAAKAGQLAEQRARADGAEAALAEMRSAGEETFKQLDDLKAESDRLRMDLEKAAADAVAAKKELEDESRAIEDLEEALLSAQKAKADAEAALLARSGEGALALEQARAELAAQAEKAKADAVAAVEAQKSEALAAAEKAKAEAVAALEQRVAMLETQRAELAAAVDKQQSEASGRSDVENALRIELEKVRSDVASARTDATTVRLDLQEALMRLDEAGTNLAALTQERDALRAEAGPLREWANKVVAEHAHQHGELERLRGLVEAGAQHAKTIAALREQITKVEGERDKALQSGGVDGAARTDDAEVVLARSRQLADLVRALEPFMWGLTQATGFYTKASVSGGDIHLKLLQQLQGVLLRLRDEIAMLDLS